MKLAINPLNAIGVLASTATTDAAFLFFTAPVSARRQVVAATWSALWSLLSALAYVAFAAEACCSARSFR
jgi:hypothetical protein